MDLTPLQSQTALEVLRLSLTEVQDLTAIKNLPKLENLDISGTIISELQPIGFMSRLRRLAASGKQITSIVPFASLPELEEVKLFTLRNVDLSPLLEIPKLRSLRLQDIEPPLTSELARALARNPKLQEFFIDKVSGIQDELLAPPSEGQPLPTQQDSLPHLRSHFEELEVSAEEEREIRVFILGNGSVGKTQLCRRFRGSPFDSSLESTHGVQVWREEFSVDAGNGENCYVNWWDFGGQDIYHGTHTLFLQSQAVFLVLWTPHLENQDEYEEQGGSRMRNHPLPYWLDLVRSRAGEQSPVIVVQSQCDRFDQKREAPANLDNFDFAQPCFYSAKTGIGRDTLQSQLRDAIAFIREQHGALKIGSGRAEVRRRLYEWHEKDQRLPEEKKKYRHLSTDEFQSLCEEVGNIVDWRHALDYFHKTGVVFYDPKLFEGRIILDQTWALDAIYAIFHREKAAPWLRDRARGRFTRRDLEALVWSEYEEPEQEIFLGMMRSCGVCFPIGETPAGETLFLAPDLLPGEEDSLPHLHAWDFAAVSPTLRLRYDFFHPALIRALMQEVGEKAGDLAHYWKYGLWFKDGSRGNSQLLARFNDISTDADPGAGELELQAQGGDAIGLLREIRRFLKRQRMGREPIETLVLEGRTLSGPEVERHLGEDRLGFEGRRLGGAKRLREEDLSTEEEPSEERGSEQLAVQPTGLTKDEKPPEVYLSYAWGDETPKGKERTETVERLCEALREDGFRPLRDQEQIRPGEQISAFMKRLVETDRLVAIVSDKYLRSPYCMYELYRVFQRSQEDAGAFAERVTPLVLPTVVLKRFPDRAPYIEYWTDEAERLEALIANPKIRASPQSWEEVQLVRDFANNVDKMLVFINDILMPRNLDAHFEDGFEAVRSALRDRMRG